MSAIRFKVQFGDEIRMVRSDEVPTFSSLVEFAQSKWGGKGKTYVWSINAVGFDNQFMPITTQEGFLKVLTAAGGTMPKFHVLRQECDDDTISSQILRKEVPTDDGYVLVDKEPVSDPAVPPGASSPEHAALTSNIQPQYFEPITEQQPPANEQLSSPSPNHTADRRPPTDSELEMKQPPAQTASTSSSSSTSSPSAPSSSAAAAAAASSVPSSSTSAPSVSIAISSPSSSSPSHTILSPPPKHTQPPFSPSLTAFPCEYANITPGPSAYASRSSTTPPYTLPTPSSLPYASPSSSHSPAYVSPSSNPTPTQNPSPSTAPYISRSPSSCSYASPQKSPSQYVEAVEDESGYITQILDAQKQPAKPYVQDGQTDENKEEQKSEKRHGVGESQRKNLEKKEESNDGKATPETPSVTVSHKPVAEVSGPLSDASAPKARVILGICSGCQSFAAGVAYQCLSCRSFCLCERCNMRRHELHEPHLFQTVTTIADAVLVRSKIAENALRSSSPPQKQSPPLSTPSHATPTHRMTESESVLACKLTTLASMGFTDTTKCEALLNTHHGDLSAVVEELLRST